MDLSEILRLGARRARLRSGLTALTVLLAVVPPTVATEANSLRALAPFAAVYKVKRGVASAEMRQTLEYADGQWLAETKLRVRGVLRLLAGGTAVERSWMVPAENGFRSLRYESIDDLSRDKHRISARFDWDQGVVTGRFDQVGFSLPIEQRLDDRVSLQYALMVALEQGRRPDRLRVLHENEVRHFDVRYLEPRTVKVPAGTYEAVGITYQRDGSSRKTTLWCAESLGYLPVVIEQSKQGKRRFRASLAEYQSVSAASDSAN